MRVPGCQVISLALLLLGGCSEGEPDKQGARLVIQGDSLTETHDQVESLEVKRDGKNPSLVQVRFASRSMLLRQTGNDIALKVAFRRAVSKGDYALGEDSKVSLEVLFLDRVSYDSSLKPVSGSLTVKSLEPVEVSFSAGVQWCDQTHCEAGTQYFVSGLIRESGD